MIFIVDPNIQTVGPNCPNQIQGCNPPRIIKQIIKRVSPPNQQNKTQKQKWRDFIDKYGRMWPNSWVKILGQEASPPASPTIMNTITKCIQKIAIGLFALGS